MSTVADRGSHLRAEGESFWAARGVNRRRPERLPSRRGLTLSYHPEERPGLFAPCFLLRQTPRVSAFDYRQLANRCRRLSRAAATAAGRLGALSTSSLSQAPTIRDLPPIDPAASPRSKYRQAPGNPPGSRLLKCTFPPAAYSSAMEIRSVIKKTLTSPANPATPATPAKVSNNCAKVCRAISMLFMHKHNYVCFQSSTRTRACP
jgi:hypothetical protein